MYKHFFDTVRPMFGSLTVEQVLAIEKIVAYAKTTKVSKLHLAYVLATIKHETADWMIPIREGARRYGRNYTDIQSRRAVASIYAKGIVSRNYALPGKHGNSFYGRGLVQTTHETNYAKIGRMVGVDLVKFPDKLLKWKYTLPATFEGMRLGTYTGKRLSMIKSRKDFVAARAIVNGDVRKNGKLVAKAANTFFIALRGYNKLPTKVVQKVAQPTKKPVKVVKVQKTVQVPTVVQKKPTGLAILVLPLLAVIAFIVNYFKGE